MHIRPSSATASRSSVSKARRYSLSEAESQQLAQAKIFESAVEHHLHFQVNRINTKQQDADNSDKAKLAKTKASEGIDQVQPVTSKRPRLSKFKLSNYVVPLSKKKHSPFPALATSSYKICPKKTRSDSDGNDNRMQSRSLYSLAMIDAL
jgi:hypothetical protein